jgi:hypothetical protein
MHNVLIRNICQIVYAILARSYSSYILYTVLVIMTESFGSKYLKNTGKTLMFQAKPFCPDVYTINIRK